MAFKLYPCKGPQGLPLLEVPDGRFIYERFSPGTMREADVYDNFRWGRGGRILFACPRGKTDKRGKCTVGQRVLRIRHERKRLQRLIRDCKSGKLYDRRKKEVDRILKDVKSELGRIGQANGGPVWHPLIGPGNQAKTPMGRLAQFAFVSLATTLMFMFWIRVLSLERKTA